MYVTVIEATIGSDEGLSPDRCQDIIWTNADSLSIRLLETNLSEILIAIQTFSFKKMHLRMSSPKWRPWCFSLNMFPDISFGYLLRFEYSTSLFHVYVYKQRVLTPGHQGWNDLHSLCRIGMEYYLLNNDDNNNDDDDDGGDDDDNNKDDDDDNRNNNNNDNDYNHNNDTNNDNNENDNDKNSSDSKPVTV